jgi:hypothetical protein
MNVESMRTISWGAMEARHTDISAATGEVSLADSNSSAISDVVVGALPYRGRWRICRDIPGRRLVGNDGTVCLEEQEGEDSGVSFEQHCIRLIKQIDEVERHRELERRRAVTRCQWERAGHAGSLLL